MAPLLGGAAAERHLSGKAIAFVAHEYFRVDLEVIQAILSEQLDQLEQTAARSWIRRYTESNGSCYARVDGWPEREHAAQRDTYA